MYNLLRSRIDGILNKITMYRVVLYYCGSLLVAAAGLSMAGVLGYSALGILVSVLYITLVCVLTEVLFGWAFDMPTNAESAYITALILALIISPMSGLHDTSFIEVATWASVLAIASKYILAIKRKHIFNPAAIGVVITSFTLAQPATWWVGTAWMLPFVAVGGFFVVRKIIRTDMVLSFLVVAMLGHWGDWNQLFLTTACVFFAVTMLTEPMTTPPTRALRIFYGALVGLLFTPALHVGTIYSTPELALVVGNIFAYIVSPKQKLMLKLKEKIQVATDTFDFKFTSPERVTYRPGQYFEWTLATSKIDTRGNRRYFTIASSPTEDTVNIGIKVYQQSSTFKQALMSMNVGDSISASQLAGEFVLPSDSLKKLVFIAGGIGITPFRSMIKYLIDKNEKRDIVLLYSNKTQADIAYKDVFDTAANDLGIKVVYAITEPQSAGYTGMVDAAMIRREILDFKDRYFYISGPHGMVMSFEQTLNTLGIPNTQIKTDFFPGFV